MNTKQNDSVEHEWMRGKCVKCGASIEQEQSVSVGEPVAVIVEETGSSRITGADFGVGCSDGFIKYSYKTAQFYPTGEKTITNFDVTWNEVLEVGTLLYTTQQPKQEQRKCDNCGEFGECCQKQEHLKPLTDEQKIALCKQFPDSLTFDAIAAIEAAHGIHPSDFKEKNT